MSKYVFGSQLRRGTQERLEAALKQDASVIADAKTIEKHPGNTTAYFESLGMTKADLIRLERVGFAVRGYTPGVRRLRWILLASGE